MKLPLLVREDPWLYAIGRLVLTTAVRLYHRFEYCGVEHLPSEGPAIVVSNHHSDIDPVALATIMPRTLHFIADVEQFQRHWMGPIIKRLGAIPIHKGSPDRKALETALRLLRAGRVVALFPEGDLYRQSELEPFGRGVAFLAVRSGAPVVPVSVQGAENVYRAGRLKWARVRVVVGEPVSMNGLPRRGAAAYAQIAIMVHDAVAALGAATCNPTGSSRGQPGT
jgi:1-acyl-sn-glycerol-3-phosphate acyltransferase